MKIKWWLGMQAIQRCSSANAFETFLWIASSAAHCSLAEQQFANWDAMQLIKRAATRRARRAACISSSRFTLKSPWFMCGGATAQQRSCAGGLVARRQGRWSLSARARSLAAQQTPSLSLFLWSSSRCPGHLLIWPEASNQAPALVC